MDDGQRKHVEARNDLFKLINIWISPTKLPEYYVIIQKLGNSIKFWCDARYF